MIDANLFIDVNGIEFEQSVSLPFLPAVGMTFVPDTFESGESYVVKRVSWDMLSRQLYVDLEDISASGSKSEIEEWMTSIGWKQCR